MDDANPDADTAESIEVNPQASMVDPDNETQETPIKLKFVVSHSTPCGLSSRLPKEPITKPFAETLCFGRGTDADVKINTETASRRHMTLRVEPSESNGNPARVVIKNIGAKKIIMVDGSAISQGQEAELKSGSNLKMEDLDVTVEIIPSDPNTTTYEVSFIVTEVPGHKPSPVQGTRPSAQPQFTNQAVLGPYGCPSGNYGYSGNHGYLLPQQPLMYNSPGGMPGMGHQQFRMHSPPPAYVAQPPGAQPQSFFPSMNPSMMNIQQPITYPPGVGASGVGASFQQPFQPGGGSSNAYGYMPQGVSVPWAQYGAQDTPIKLSVQATAGPKLGPAEETGKGARTSIEETDQ